MTFLEELLNVLRSRTTSAGLEQATTVDQRNDGEHPRRGAELEDREQVGQVIPQNVTGCGNSVLALANQLEGESHRFARRHDLDVKTRSIVIRQVLFDLGDDLLIVTTLFVEPENTRLAGSFGAIDSQLDPVLNRNIFGLAGTIDVTSRNRLLHQYGTVGSNNLELTVARCFEGLVVGTVLFSLLGHQADVGNATHGGRIELAVLVGIVNDLGVHGGVAAIRDHSDGGLQFISQVPHAATVTHNVRHRCINDNIVRHVQVGDVLAGVDHGQGSLAFVTGVDVCFDFSFLGFRQLVQLVEDVTHTEVRVGADFLQGISVLLKGILEVNLDAVAEHDRIGDLHHGCLEVQGEQYALLFCLLRSFSVELLQLSNLHDRAVEDFAGLQGNFFFDFYIASSVNKLNLDSVSSVHGDRFFGLVEVTTVHVGNAALGGAWCRPRLHHPVRVLLRKLLYRSSSAAIGVAFTQNRVNRGTKNLGETSLQLFFFRSVRFFRVARDIVALLLQFGDAILQLRDRSTDVRQLDDVRFRSLNDLAKLGQVVSNLLLRLQALRESSDNATGQGNVLGLDVNASAFAECLHDRQKCESRQRRCFINFGPDNFCHSSLSLKC